MWLFRDLVGFFLKVVEQNYSVLPVPDAAFIGVTMMLLCFQISLKIMVVVLSLLLSHRVPFQSLCLGIMQKTADRGEANWSLLCKTKLFFFSK